MRLTLDPLRTSLLAALGLLACNPKPGEDTSDTQADTTVDPSTSGSSVTTGPGTGETGGETGGTMGGTVGGTSTNGTITGATDETGATTTPVTTGATEDTGETGEPFVCKGTVEKLPQGNTDPPVDSGFEKCDGGIIHRAEKAKRNPMQPTRPMPAPWTVRLSNVRLPRPSSSRPDSPPAAARPGIAARWKPRDRARSAGN